MTAPKDRISIAILALGGQGGGVLAEWIQHVAREAGWLAQGTSVPGVAQRTGSTVYYVELAKQAPDGRLPVMAQMPMPGDVDIVVASELMETGRALLRNFSTADRTVLIGSTHRVYAISEKSAMGDGRGSSDRIIEAAGQRSKRFIGFDMEAATERSGSVISAIMFGALGGSGALPFNRELFEQAIKDSGIAVASNLKGFEEGFQQAQGKVALPAVKLNATPTANTAAGKILEQRAVNLLPKPARANALHGIERLMDYQDADYGTLYLDRLLRIAAVDRAPFSMTTETARHLALWMSYEDVIRVADLKTRGSRIERVRGEVLAKQGQLLDVTEYMHPRLREIGEAIPAFFGRPLLGNGALPRFLSRFFQEGRHVQTTSLRWFLMLRTVAGLRRWRRASIRFQEEQERIEQWLTTAEKLAQNDVAQAEEWIVCQRLIKGYGDTFDRGLRNFTAIAAAFEQEPRPPGWLTAACQAALSGEDGAALKSYLASA